MSVTSIRRCNATNTSGCRRLAPAADVPEYLLSVDPATNTIYGGNQSQPQIDVINSATCNTGACPAAPRSRRSRLPGGANVGASIRPPTPCMPPTRPPATSRRSTLPPATRPHRRLRRRLPAVKIGAVPEVPAINPGTQTMYVSYGGNANKVAVVNAATCNATNTSGCCQARP